MDCKPGNYRVLMLPWLAHGHISPFLELAKRLTKSDFQVYLCSTPINLNPIRENAISSNFSSIQFVDIHLSTSLEFPADYHTTKNLPPHLMPTLKTAFDGAKDNFRDILKTFKPDLVIYDFLQPWAPEVASEEKINSVLFLTFGVATSAFLVHHTTNPDAEFPFPALKFPQIQSQKLVQFMYEVSNCLTSKERFLGCIERSSSFVLIKTSNEIEAKYIDFFSALVRKEVVSVGTLVQYPIDITEDSVLMDWLSKKEPQSLVFISFGSEYFLSKEEIEEIAYGLELSNVNFIWVVRFHGGEKIGLHETLPEGFQKRVGERGMIVEGWAPQAKILRHSSIGGFVSHCGWSSMLEAMEFGVPIIAMPMHLDQPINARLAVDLGIGMEVRRVNGKFSREDIAKIIREVVMEEGKEIKENVNKLRDKLRDKSDDDMNIVASRLVQLAQNFDN
ncbi:UDP-glycosyltransferase 91B1 [Abeliophyllum distichum]|uniref:Glycosyltransferase n=1 Tax=Abeliophyllum distichum TaxID=126358 RepID=A0ABD1TF05_9LAMI